MQWRKEREIAVGVIAYSNKGSTSPESVNRRGDEGFEGIYPTFSGIGSPEVTLPC